MNKITEDQLKYFYVEKGLSITDIAKELEVTESSVMYYFKKYNFVPREIKQEQENTKLRALYIKRANKLYAEGFTTMARWSQMIDYINKKYPLKR